MDFKQIQELIKIVNKSNIGELSVEDKGFKITIKQKEEPVPVYTSAAPQPQLSYAPAPVQTVAASATSANTPASAPVADTKVDNYVIIRSPMIGTFYRSSTPDKPVFVSVGDEITPGKSVCIIEAMKLFNEIESEISGTIVKVLAEDASPVEYDQPLFLVDPS